MVQEPANAVPGGCMTEYLTHEPGTIVDSPGFTLTLTKSGDRPKIRIDVPDGTDLKVSPPQYKGWSIASHAQHHKDFLPWNAIAKRTTGTKIEYVNAEGRTVDEAVKNLKALLERKR
jgi:hypothetical protein